MFPYRHTIISTYLGTIIHLQLLDDKRLAIIKGNLDLIKPILTEGLSLYNLSQLTKPGRMTNMKIDCMAETKLRSFC